MRTVVEMKGISKSFGTLLANNNIDFDVMEGETHALVGENGAGKTTLMRILYGQYKPDAGEIFINNEKSPNTISGTLKLGIGMVHQNFMQIEGMSVVENVILGQAPGKYGFIDYNVAKRRVSELCERFRLKVLPDSPISGLCVGERQKIEIIKTLYRGAKILILDEPTAVLTPQETRELFDIMDELKKDGASIIFISHKLREVITVGDRITVMRNGKVTAKLNKGQTNETDIARAMIGKQEFRLLQNEKNTVAGEVILKAEHLWSLDDNGIAKVKDFSFELRSGEILGIGGVEGNGQSELIDILIGMFPPSSGKIVLADIDVTHMSINRRKAHGLGYIPEDRMTTGLAIDANLDANIICGIENNLKFSKNGFLKIKNIERNSEDLIKQFNIRGVERKKSIRGMSGGNLQKIVLARELSRKPSVLVAVHPTRGLDIGAVNFVREQLLEQKNSGTAIILVTADLEELMSLSNRIIIMYEGRCSGEIEEVLKVTEEDIGLMMGGITSSGR